MQKTPHVQSRIGFYVSMFLYTLVALFIRAIAIVPIVVALLMPDNASIALLTPALYLLIVLPLRISFADALVQKEGQRAFSWKRAFSFSNYFGKLGHSICHLLRMMLWGIPLYVFFYLVIDWYNQEDMHALVMGVYELGKESTAFFNGIHDFFVSLFGGTPAIHPDGGLMEGLYAVLGIIGVGALIWVYGAVRNSANRYVFISAMRNETTFSKQARKQLRGRRLKQCLVGLINVMLVLPVWIVIFSQIKPVVVTISQSLLLMIMTNQFPSVDLVAMCVPIVLVLVCYYLPLIPLRRILVANFATTTPKAVAQKA